MSLFCNFSFCKRMVCLDYDLFLPIEKAQIWLIGYVHFALPFD